MAVQLEIDDGVPWYLSPDIWVVPGSNPNGPIGLPNVQDPAYIWARVHNRGTTPVENATIRYYWADPSTLITRASAHLVGTSFVSLAPGETKEVLCLVPWRPVWLNGGHECLLAEASSLEDPLPPHAPMDPFDPPIDRHVAQRNIGLVQSMPDQPMAMMWFMAQNSSPFEDEIKLRVSRESIEAATKLRASLGIKEMPAEAPRDLDFGIQLLPVGTAPEGVGKRELTLALRRGQREACALVVKLREGAALFLVEQMGRDGTAGGLGVIVVGADEHIPTGLRKN